jgi:hypothetical protein
MLQNWRMRRESFNCKVIKMFMELRLQGERVPVTHGVLSRTVALTPTNFYYQYFIF